MPDRTDATYEVRVLIYVDRELTDDEQRSIGDTADALLGRLADVIEYSGYTGQTTLNMHGPTRVIA